MDGQAPMWLAQFLLLAFFTAPVWIAVLAFLLRHKLRDIARRKRDREIEIAMRLGMADAQAKRRIAQQILREHE